MKQLLSASAVLALLAIPALGAEITGAGSGSTGGTMTGKPPGSGMSTSTGAANGSEPVTSQNGRSGVGTGDNAVLNAPGEAKPGSKPASMPSNLNGSTQ